MAGCVCGVHGAPQHNCVAVGYVPTTSPLFTTLPMLSPNMHRSPQLTLGTPVHMTSPLPTFAVVNFPTSRGNSPSPVVQNLLLTTTLQVNPLVAVGMELYSSKISYDVSKEPHTSRISRCGITTSLSEEEKDFLVVEGALMHTNCSIEFDHPVLQTTIRCDSSLTIGDFVTLLYSHFRERLGSRETASLSQDMDLFTEATKNQNKRCRTTHNPRAEWGQGMKRIDVLGRECKFRGVELDTMSGQDTITLRVVFGR